MAGRIAILLITTIAAATAVDNSTMHIMEGPNSSTADPCDTMKCSNGTVCQLQTVNCIKAPCPPIANCVAPSNNTVDPCAAVKCANGTICKLQTVNCLLPPCPPLPQCVAPSTGPSCMTMKCAANTTCVDLPTGSVCQPNGSNNTVDPCASIKCGNGTICALQTVNCLLPPCPPLAQCITPPAGPSCMTMKCAANTTCVDLPTGSVCQPNGGDNSSTTNPCASMLCAVGTVCELQNVICKREPCPPVAACVPRTMNHSACMHIKCSAGFECRNGDKGEMCYPVSAPQPDACANHTCPMGQACRVVMINCLVAPCPSPKPSCIPRHRDDACQLTECAKGFFCITQDGESPCNAMECAKGLFCIVQHGEPECVAHSGASCAATSCPVNTTCIEFREGATCMAAAKETIGLWISMVVGGASSTHSVCRNVRTPAEELPRAISRFLLPPTVPHGLLQTAQYGQTQRWEIPPIYHPIAYLVGIHAPIIDPDRCVCRDKFKRNVQGNCVPNSRCWLTPGCRDNESWSRCVGCERTCANPAGAQICAAVCRSGCACDEGYVRSKRGMCVLPEDCRAIDLINGDHGNHTISIVG
ncbi:hypothetical protein PRIPAC_75340 [Pristionchus pacificus]|uniref:Uncharacterized protein n=1 Tax=Pristionchus pacificus TaxID=54126 RepID=A0A2A6C690_PRIPA|nr:hypothetical protein PRIPAC_75340 [Pristionchus pacificus]|eukprot:PDM73650.1 hypothetical protein PRIPAC_41006 [Pristionchus pacificus]